MTKYPRRGFFVSLVLLLSLTGCATRRDASRRRLVEEKDIPLGASNAIPWNGSWVVRTKAGFQVLDVGAASTRPLQLPGLDSLIALAGSHGGMAWALGKVGERLKLLRGLGASFEEQPLPENLDLSRSEDRSGWGWALLAEGDTLVVVDPDRDAFHVLQEGAWRKLPFRVPGEEGERYPNWSLHWARLLLRGSTLYVGFDVGEWGGGLYTLSLESGELKEVCPQVHDPIVGLAFAPDGRLWFADGMSHLGARRGRLWRVDAEGCTLVTSAQKKDQGETPWNLEPTSFEGLALDSRGEPHVLGWEVGVVHRQGQGWEAETLDWVAQTRDFNLATPLYITMFAPLSLALEEETALIGTNHEGLLLWKLGTRELRQALVPP